MLESHIALLDYRRRVSDLYNQVRNPAILPETRWDLWRAGRDALFRDHPQSALDVSQKKAFSGLNYFPYDPAWRLTLPLNTDVEPEVFEVPLQDDGVFKMQRFASARFDLQGEPVSLALYWVLGYGGGVFLPFRDQTNKTGQTYGGGRYLLDTIKHADLGIEEEKIVLDFNFAYNPSCAYNPSWHCPLAPQENWLAVAMNAGEQGFQD